MFGLEDAVKLDVPDDIVRRAEATALELHIALAVQLYADNRIDHRDACQLSGLSEALFNREALTRNLPSTTIRPAAPPSDTQWGAGAAEEKCF